MSEGSYFHLGFTVISRGGGTAASASKHRSAGHSATSAATYRNGQNLKNERTGEWSMGDRSTYGLRIIGSEIISPEWAPKNLLTSSGLWNAVERIEKRKDARLATDCHIGLPMDWTQRQRETIVREFVWQEFTCRGIIVEASFHAYGSSFRPGTEAWSKREADLAKIGAPYYELKDRPTDATSPYVLNIRRQDGSVKEHYVFQPHVHLLMPFRTVTAEGLSPHKIRCPDGHTNNKAWERQQLIDLRKAWERHANIYLAPDRQIHAGSHKARGIEREAQVNVGMAGTKLARDGKSTERWFANEKIKDLNTERAKRARLTHFKSERAKVDAEIVAFRPEQRRVKMDTQTPEEFVGRTQKERQAAYNELEEKWQSRQRLGARWQRAADVNTDSLLHQAHQTLAQGRDHILTQQAAERKAAAQLDLNQQEEARRRSRGMTADPQLRHSIAVGETAGTNGDWVAKCMAAHGAASAAFLKEQDRYRRQLADPKISASDKQEIALRQQIEYLDYRGFTNKDLAKTYDLIGGKGHTDRAQELRDQMLKEGMLADSLKEKHASLLRGREMELDQKRAAGYEGPERRFTDQEFERKHAERVLFLRQHGGNSAQIHRHKAAHAEQRQVREEYGMQQRFERRATAETIKPERAPGAVIQRGETDRQKENRDYHQTATGEGQGAKVSREREGVAGREMTDQMRAFNANERQHSRQTTLQRQKSQERERTAGE